MVPCPEMPKLHVQQLLISFTACIQSVSLSFLLWKQEGWNPMPGRVFPNQKTQSRHTEYLPDRSVFSDLGALGHTGEPEEWDLGQGLAAPSES